MVLVDSSVWIEAFKRTGDLATKVSLEALLEEYEALWCAPVKLEVLGGARKEVRPQLEFFFQNIPYRDIEETALEDAKRLSWRLRDKGFSLPWFDILIASLALNWDVRVYSADRHFEVISQETGLRLYRSGYGGKYQPE